MSLSDEVRTGYLNHVCDELPTDDWADRIATLKAELAESKVDLKDAKGEIAELDALNIKLSKLLDGVCESVKGTPPEETLYSWHDLPEMAKELKENMMKAEELTNKSIDAYQRLDSKHCDLKVDIPGLETRNATLAAELRRRSEWHHPACRKLMYDIGSSPCTCEQEYKSENATLTAELAISVNTMDMQSDHVSELKTDVKVLNSRLVIADIKLKKQRKIRAELEEKLALRLSSIDLTTEELTDRINDLNSLSEVNINLKSELYRLRAELSASKTLLEKTEASRKYAKDKQTDLANKYAKQLWLTENAEKENATLTAGRERLSEALTAIKNLVVGDKRPNWDGIVATTVTRNLIADYCDAAMPKPPPETT